MENLFMYGGIAVAVIAFLIILWTCYVQSPPSQALILSGLTKNPRTLIGTGGFKIPLLERKDRVYLGQIGVDIQTKEPVPTLDFIMSSPSLVSILGFKSKTLLPLSA